MMKSLFIGWLVTGWLVTGLLGASAAIAGGVNAVVPLPATADDVTRDAGAEPWRSPLADPEADPEWAGYLAAWQAHRVNPADANLRSRLGLPPVEACQVEVSDGTSAAREVGRGTAINWSNPRRIDTRHFAILADIDPEIASEIAIDLERFHAVWTQLFFPLWKDRLAWDRADPTKRRTGGVGVTTNRGSGIADRGGPAARHRVVIFRDPDQYAAALAAQEPSIHRSTGFYWDKTRTTYLRLSGDTAAATDRAVAVEARATRYHELTHQLLAEATEARGNSAAGPRSGFWLAEGIACLMEATVMGDGRVTVGGWDASRLQFARHRVLATGDSLGLAELDSWSRAEFLRANELTRSYAFASAHAHRIADRADGTGWTELLARLARIYQIRTTSPLPPIPKPTARGRDADANELRDYLMLTEETLTPIARDDLVQLCLARCPLDPETLRRIPPQRDLRWLDLTAIPVTPSDVTRLLPDPANLEQFSLEATAVDVGLAEWLSQARSLTELDLSWARVDDAMIAALAEAVPLDTLWLTGTGVTDASLERIASIKTLRRLDVQRTAVTAAGRQRFRGRRPDVTLDPLKLVTPP